MTQLKKTEFEALYADLFPKVVKFALHLCRNRDDAEDVAQEAFLKAYKAFESCDADLCVDNWLMKIVFNTFLDRKRASSRRIREYGESFEGVEIALENCVDPQFTAEEMLLRGVVSPELLAAMKALDSHSRALVQKLYFERVEQDDLRMEYGIHAGALRSKIHRINLRLREELSNSTGNSLAPNRG